VTRSGSRALQTGGDVIDAVGRAVRRVRTERKNRREARRVGQSVLMSWMRGLPRAPATE